MSDLVHEGIVGLIRAVNRFDPHRGCRLATFAICWIKGYIQNFILKCWRLVKFGTTQAQRRLFYRLKRLKAQDDAILTDDVRRTLAEDLEITEHEVIEMEIRLNAGELSLHAPLLDHPDLTLMDSVPDPAPNPEELVAAKLLRTHLICQIQNAINKLDPREKMVITKRYFAASPWTLAKLGDHFSVTRERVRQLEQRALNKLRTELESTMTEAFPN